MTTSESQTSKRGKQFARRICPFCVVILVVGVLMGLLFLLPIASKHKPFTRVVQAAPASAPLVAPPTAEPGFVPQVFAAKQTSVSAVAVGDLNGDGFLDLVLGNMNARNEVYLNDPTGSFDAPKRLPFGPDSGTELLAVGDMNSDGKLDVVIGNRDAGNLIYINNGSGDFSETMTDTFGLPGDEFTALAIGDMDGNATYDIVVGQDDRPNLILYNHPYSATHQTLYSGIYTATHYFSRTNVITFGPQLAHTQSLALGHLNDDRFLDIVVGTRDANDAVYFNEGKTEFISRTLVPPITKLAGTSSIVLGDFDGDTDLDVVAAYPNTPGDSEIERLALYRNDGDGNLLVCSSQLDSGQDRTAGWKDVNGDGKPDIILGPKDAGWFDKVLLNDGTGKIISCKSNFGRGMGRKWDVAVGDVDGDGALDLLYGIEGSDWFTRILLNDGDGDFSRRNRFPIGQAGNDATNALAMADMNSDGMVDLLIGNTKQRSAIYLNTGVVNFVNDSAHTIETLKHKDFPTTQTKHLVFSIAVGDIDNDGYLDIVAGRSFENDDPPASDLVVFVNNRQGDFLTYHFPPFPNTTLGVAVADLDKDGLLDIVTANGKKANLIYYNVAKDLNTNVPMTQTFGELSNNTVSVAVGDLDHNGYLDIVAGNNGQPNTIYFYDKTGEFLKERAYTLPGGNSHTQSIAVGDVNDDGFLDIIAGNKNESSLVFVNDGHGNFPLHLTRRFGAKIGNTQAVAVGDINNDGALDIVLGNFDEVNYVFLNDREGNFPSTLAYTIDPKPARTYSIAVGDINGDGFLDIIAGNWNTIDNQGQQNVIYFNDGTGRFTATRFTASDYTRSVALGDLNNDGTLDIVIGNRYQDSTELDSPPIAVYLNPIRASSPLPDLAPIVTVSRPVTTPNANFYSSPIIRAEPIITVPYKLLDETGQPTVARLIRGCYSRVGGGGWRPAVEEEHNVPSMVISSRYGCPYVSTINPATSTQTLTHEFRWDTFASGFFGRSDSVVFRIEAYPDLKPIPNSVPGPYQFPYATAVTFPFRVQGTQARAAFKGAFVDDEIIYKAPFMGVTEGEPIVAAAVPLGAAQPGNQTGPDELRGPAADGTGGDQLVAMWPLTDVVSIPSLPVKTYAAHATWPMTLTLGRTNEVTLTVPDARRITEIVVWVDITQTQDISAVLELVPPRGAPMTLVRGQFEGNSFSGEWSGRTSQAGAALSTSVQMTGELASVLDELANGAWKLRIDITTTTAITPVLLTDWGIALRLSPVFLTSAEPTPSGLAMTRVINSGIQTLTLTLTNTLTLFDLNIALEWDASTNEQFVNRLTTDIKRASALLYDWTNGQAALGRINIYHDGKRNQLSSGANAWNEADVRIYASNRLRPNADQGGVISEIFSETVMITLTDRAPITHTHPVTYAPGQARMGAEWNRYGEVTGNLGDDWARAFAHELGHYLLFLDDNYIGLIDDSKMLVTINDIECPGAMNNPYSDLHSEFHPAAGWHEKPPRADLHSCQDTFSHQNLGRSDWETIHHFYPWITPPLTTQTITQTNSGPAVLPLPVTEVEFVNSTEMTRPLALPIFYLYQDNKPYYASPRARAFLRQEQPDGRMIDLGQPTRDQVFAHGARPGDTICVFDVLTNDVPSSGGVLPRGDYVQQCITVQSGVDRINLIYSKQWQPAVIVAPSISTPQNISVTSPSITVPLTPTLAGSLHPADAPALQAFMLNISVTLPYAALPPTTTLYGRLYPADAPASQEFTFTQTGQLKDTSIAYSHLFRSIDAVLEGHVCIWTDSSVGKEHCEIITDFAVGGNLVSAKGRHVSAKGRHVSAKGRHTNLRARHAPISSSDGQVVVYIDDAIVADTNTEWLFTIQPAAALSNIPSWATVVGKAYWLHVAPQNFDLKQSFLSFEYLGSDVPAGAESSLRLYSWNKQTATWDALRDLVRDTDHNVVSARIVKGGLYALMTSFEMSLQPGWNLLGYPVQTSEPITQSLQSIAGKYSVVYDYVEDDKLWKFYTPEVGISNTLTTLEFGKGYWIHITKTESITLYLRNSFTGTANETGSVTPVSLSGTDLLRPPTIYFGRVMTTTTFTTTAGLTVVAFVNGTKCGSGSTRSEANQIVYAVAVRSASEGENSQCGREGAVITFSVNDKMMANWTPWDDRGLQNLNLRPPQ